jgi:salicylate 5-hydroxylase small subunit
VYNVGRYIDEIMRTDGALKFASRLCVYDSEMVLNSLIYPI